MARGFFSTNSNYNNGSGVSNASTMDFRQYGEEIAHLKGQVARLNMITEGLWTILKNEGHTEEELIDILSELDTNKKNRKAAIENGEETPKRRECPNCHVPLQNTDSIIDRCIYCGHEIIGNPFDN
jgi:hypothetical protein